MQNKINNWTIEKGDYLNQLDDSILKHERIIRRGKVISRATFITGLSMILVVFIVIIKFFANHL